MKWYQAIRCADDEPCQEYLFGIVINCEGIYTRLNLKETTKTYSWYSDMNTWSYLTSDVKLIYKGG